MNIVVVGGGTSGCISALILKQRFPQYDIHIIESSKIGTIGVGEGSTEHWTDFCDYVDIDMGDVLRECGATFKMGISLISGMMNHSCTLYYQIPVEMIMDTTIHMHTRLQTTIPRGICNLNMFGTMSA